MNGAWIVLVLLWCTDWPWLWVLVGWVWIAEWGRWPLSAVPYGVVLAVVLTVEGALAALASRRPAEPRRRSFGAEGAVFAWSAAHFGAVPGFLLWQATTGFDAAQRLDMRLRRLARNLPARAIRFVVGVAVLWYLIAVG